MWGRCKGVVERVSLWLKWLSENLLTLLGLALTALGTFLTAIGYWQTKRINKTAQILNSLRDAYRLYESALKVQLNCSLQRRKQALSSLYDLLFGFHRYRCRFGDTGLNFDEWERLISLAEEVRLFLERGTKQDVLDAQKRIVDCAIILNRLIGNLEQMLDSLIGGEKR
jgi:hypothetical protein